MDRLSEMFGDPFSDMSPDVRALILRIATAVAERGFDVMAEPQQVLSRDLGPGELWGDGGLEVDDDEGQPHRTSVRRLAPPRSAGQGSGSGGHQSSGGGSGTSINIIPPPRGVPSFCCPVVLAIARGSRPPTGLAMVLRLLRQHLIHCGTGPAALFNRTAILVTDHWDRRLIYESGYDLHAHAQTGGLRTALLQWDGKNWYRQVI